MVRRNCRFFYQIWL